MRRVTSFSAHARARNLRTSPRKLNLVAASIRGKKADAALVSLAYEPRRIAGEVRKVLQAAIANAENNHDLDIDTLYVEEAWVGRSFVMKRMHARGRGRGARVEKPFSNLTIVVAERKSLITSGGEGNKPYPVTIAIKDGAATTQEPEVVVAHSASSSVEKSSS